MKSHSIRYWLLSLIFIIPVVLIYTAHYFPADTSLAPTGFILGDMAYYMANAREHFDTGSFQITYGNPFSPYYKTPPIYFQPMTLLLGIFWKMTNWDPGVIFMFFGFIAAIICARVAIGLYRQVVGFQSWAHWLGLVLFFYGGGTLVLAGIFFGNGSGPNLNTVFRFDPFGGWWFLNFGRNLVLPTEALYHALFLGSILCLFKKYYFCSLVLCLLLSMSQPFAGIELILILLTWGLLETYFLQNSSIPRYFLPTCFGIFLYHIGYYIGFLNLFPEHRQLVSQWSLPWEIKAQNIIPAYCLVAILAVWRIRRFHLAADFFSDMKNRLLMVWFLVAFILANHELITTPTQPIHFTRGYIWIPLFLIGSISLINLFHLIKAKMNRFYFLGGIAVISAIFLADNGIWIGSRLMAFSNPSISLGLYRTRPQKEVLEWINNSHLTKYVVLSQDLLLSYYIPCYTPLRCWHSHLFNTPYANIRKRELIEFYDKGRFNKAWESMPLLIIFLRETGDRVFKDKPPWLLKQNGIRVFQNKTYSIFKLTPKDNINH